jgi:hypothetical protein
MQEQRQSAEQHRSSVVVTAFYATSALVASLGMAILLTRATIAYTLGAAIALKNSEHGRKQEGQVLPLGPITPSH